jgi:prepilin signal peptidase PulO-like enzyme (type II secretory pathway)
MMGTRQFGETLFPGASYATAALLLLLYCFRQSSGASASTDNVSDYLFFGISCLCSAHISVSDARTLKIPLLQLSIIGLSAILAAATSQTILASSLAATSAAVTLLLARQLTTYLTQKPSIGIGDIVLSFCLGLWLSPATLPLALIIALTFTALFRLIADHKLGPRIPFAPGIAFSFCLVAAIG